MFDQCDCQAGLFLAIGGLCGCIGPPQVASPVSVYEEFPDGKGVKST